MDYFTCSFTLYWSESDCLTASRSLTYDERSTLSLYPCVYYYSAADRYYVALLNDISTGNVAALVSAPTEANAYLNLLITQGILLEVLSKNGFSFYVLGSDLNNISYLDVDFTPGLTSFVLPYIDFSDSGGGSTETYGVYNLKYIINGETATTQLLNINTTTYGGQEVTVSLSEDEKTINVTLDGNIISSYTSLDKKLKELTPTSFTILESETAQTITISATSYTEQPSFTGGVILDLYQSTAESNRLDKTKYLTSVGTLNGAFREETNVLNPSITIEYVGVPDFNYVYIPSLNRYYFVTNVTSIRYNVWQIDMSVDVLMTYKDAIIRCPAFIDRNENTYNDNIIDTRRVIEQGYDVEETTLTNELFDTANLTSDSFVLTGFAIKGV